MTKPITKAECEEVIERLAEVEYHPGDKLKTTPSYHSVRIGDVLKKDARRYNDEEHGTDFIDRADLVHSNCPELFELWLACEDREGGTKSLQQILAEAEVVWCCDACGHPILSEDGGCEREYEQPPCNGNDNAELEYLKGPAADLFTFLKSIL